MENEMSSSSSDRPVIAFRDVGKVYDDDGLRVTAIKSVTFDIPRKRFAMIVGPSGSGKTTLLNLVGCIDTPTSGLLEVAGQNIAELAKLPRAMRARRDSSAPFRIGRRHGRPDNS
jgi:ABC-type lipoprotein export system ATPase subunit